LVLKSFKVVSNVPKLLKFKSNGEIGGPPHHFEKVTFKRYKDHFKSILSLIYLKEELPHIQQSSILIFRENFLEKEQTLAIRYSFQHFCCAFNKFVVFLPFSLLPLTHFLILHFPLLPNITPYPLNFLKNLGNP
jgi:hypothetical protein